jgi:opacity protein-like surface antigen
MNLCKHIGLWSALLALPTVGQARAADYEPPIAIEEVPQYVPVEVGSGWYLRGDLTYNIDRTEPEFSNPFITDTSHTSFGGGGGVGYHFNDLIRGELNVAFLSKDSFDYDDGIDVLEFESQAWTGMANLYFDLGTFAGLTPYVGGGVGLLYSRNTLDGSSLGLAIDETDDGYKFAYSLGAGVNYKITKNTSVDLGYQFVSSPDTEYLNVTSEDVEVRDGLDFHQIKVGLRYDIW